MYVVNCRCSCENCWNILDNNNNWWPIIKIKTTIKYVLTSLTPCFWYKQLTSIINDHFPDNYFLLICGSTRKKSTQNQYQYKIPIEIQQNTITGRSNLTQITKLRTIVIDFLISVQNQCKLFLQNPMITIKLFKSNMLNI